MAPFRTRSHRQRLSHQRALLLPAAKQPYLLEEHHPVPTFSSDDELLVRTLFIGLNPIDWKAPDFGFGIPQLPYISGRELSGVVARPSRVGSRLQPGDKVIVISTDYRDLRKAAYQEYVVANSFNMARLPPNVTFEQGSAIGVAFVTAALTLGVCTGLNFSAIADGPDLLDIIQGISKFQLPEDIRLECTQGVLREERARSGDWIAIWGGSSTCSFILNQIARQAGLRTIIVLDLRKHGATLAAIPAFEADVVVDAHDPQRAIEVIRAITRGTLRFAVDVVGRKTAEYLQQCLQQSPLPKHIDGQARRELQDFTPPGTPHSEPSTPVSHLVGLTGVPKIPLPGVKCHAVPVKLFHEVSEVGEAIVLWLEQLLADGLLVPPQVLGVVDGLEGINDGLDRMRRGEISGGRLVAKVA